MVRLTAAILANEELLVKLILEYSREIYLSYSPISPPNMDVLGITRLYSTSTPFRCASAYSDTACCVLDPGWHSDASSCPFR